MKKFEIIEEGRLSKSEMNQVTGGRKSCGTLVTSPYSDSCEWSGYVVCGHLYFSCTRQANISCLILSYTGPRGPGGIVSPDLPKPELPIIEPPITCREFTGPR